MFEKYRHDADKHKHIGKAFYRLHFSNILINKTKLNNVLLLQTLMAFIFLPRKKINAAKRFWKKAWSSGVAAGYAGTSWVRKKGPIQQKVFFSSKVSPYLHTHIAQY